MTKLSNTESNIEREAYNHVITAMAMLVREQNNKHDFENMDPKTMDNLQRKYHVEAINKIKDDVTQLYDGPIHSMAEEATPKSYSEMFNS